MRPKKKASRCTSSNGTEVYAKLSKPQKKALQSSAIIRAIRDKGCLKTRGKLNIAITRRLRMVHSLGILPIHLLRVKQTEPEKARVGSPPALLIQFPHLWLLVKQGKRKTCCPMSAKHSLKKSTFQRTQAKTHGSGKGALGRIRWGILPQETMEYAASFKSRKITLHSFGRPTSIAEAICYMRRVSQADP